MSVYFSLLRENEMKVKRFLKTGKGENTLLYFEYSLKTGDSR